MADNDDLERFLSAQAPIYADALAELESARKDRHLFKTAPADLQSYSASGLPITTMGRTLEDDPLFFAAPLAAGRLLSEISPGDVGAEVPRT